MLVGGLGVLTIDADRNRTPYLTHFQKEVMAQQYIYIYIDTYIHICQATYPHALLYCTAMPRMQTSSTLARRQKRYAFCWSRLVRHLCIYRIYEASVNPLSNSSIDLLLMGWMRGGNSSHRLQSESRCRYTYMVHGQCSISTFTHSHCGPV